MTDLELLTKTATALFGPLWQSELGRQLGVADRTVRRWVAGKAPVPAGVWSSVRDLLDRRRAELAELRPILTRQSRKAPADD